jgi:hypothetical protein
MSRPIWNAKLDGVALALILLVYLPLALSASPFYEFPLNDDVIYAEAVQTLLETGQLKLSPWVAPTLILQVVYGAAVSKLFGFSFTTLRLTTLVLSLASTSSLYLFLRTLNLNHVLSLCGALTLALNPVYLNLSYTFMTEVPFIAFLLFSLLCYTRGLTRNSYASVLAGSVFAAASLLIRQVGVILPVAVVLSTFFGDSGSRRSRRRDLILLSSALPIVTFTVYSVWLRMIHGPTRALGAFFDLSVLLNPFSLAGMALDHGFATLEYVGLFIAPLLPLWLGRRKSEWPRAIRPRLLLLWTGFVALGVLIMYLVGHGKVMPYTGNILHEAGVGALTLKDAVFDDQLPLLRLPKSFWWLVTLLASLSAVLIGSVMSWQGIQLVAGWRGKTQEQRVPDTNILWMLWFATFGFLGVGLLVKQLFDRYLTPLLVLLIPLLLLTVRTARWKRYAIAGTFVLLLSYGTFGALGTRDYLAWNEARWTGIYHLVSEMDVNPSSIDAGYEANYWYNYANATTKVDSWWWTKEPLFYLTFTPLQGYEVAMTIPYHRSLPPLGVERIYVLYREGRDSVR